MNNFIVTSIGDLLQSQIKVAHNERSPANDKGKTDKTAQALALISKKHLLPYGGLCLQNIVPNNDKKIARNKVKAVGAEDIKVKAVGAEDIIVSLRHDPNIKATVISASMLTDLHKYLFSTDKLDKILMISTDDLMSISLATQLDSNVPYKEHVTNYYLSYLINSIDFNKQVELMTYTNARDSKTSQGRILLAKFNLPSVAEQEKIVEVLRPIDDRIWEVQVEKFELEQNIRNKFEKYFIDDHASTWTITPFCEYLKETGIEVIKTQGGNEPSIWRYFISATELHYPHYTDNFEVSLNKFTTELGAKFGDIVISKTLKMFLASRDIGSTHQIVFRPTKIVDGLYLYAYLDYSFNKDKDKDKDNDITYRGLDELIKSYSNKHINKESFTEDKDKILIARPTNTDKLRKFKQELAPDYEELLVLKKEFDELQEYKNFLQQVLISGEVKVNDQYQLEFNESEAY